MKFVSEWKWGRRKMINDKDVKQLSVCSVARAMRSTGPREDMRKRGKRMSACCIWLSITVIALTFYFSAFIEVSYYLRVHKKSANFYEQIAALTNRGGTRENKPQNEESSSITNCQALHLALVCGGFESSNRLSTLIKSILSHRRQPLVLHLLVDDVARKILTVLFSTWQLPAVQLFFYNMSEYAGHISWIPNRHYSGNHGLMKLLLVDVFPAGVQKIIALDTDVLLADDIAQLWSFFEKMNTLQAIGLVENLSDWYLPNVSTPQRRAWPAWGRGYNTGVMLMDLTKLRKINWTRMWRETTSKNLPEFGATQLADQDIINAVINDYPWIVLKLPCEWNFQMGLQSQQSLCSLKLSVLKLVHWNSPLKTKTMNRHAVFFHRHYKKIKDMDGNMFRFSKLDCSDSFESSELSKIYEYDDNDDGCGELRHARWIRYRTQLYIRPYIYTALPEDVVLGTQFTMDRLVHFDALLQFWSGPVSAAVYLSDSELSLLTRYIDDTKMLANRTNIALHAVYKEGIHYPINYLRNVALNSTDAAFIFLTDVDFLPAPGLYTMLRQKLAAVDLKNRKAAFVVPAFEYRGLHFPAVPRTKNDLIIEIDAGRMQIFRQDVWIQGHAATDYDRWRHADREYSITWSTDYEPYVVVRRDEVPPYDQRFVGFGWNKVSHMMSLNGAGFEFVVLPDVFIIHQPHLPSYEIAQYRSLASYRKCLKALKGEFVRDLIWEQNRKQNLSLSL